MRYEDYVRQHVLQPAGMDQTAVDDLYQIVPDRARGYQLLDAESYKGLPPAVQKLATLNAVYNASLHDTSMKIAGGGWVSTASDLARFGSALMAGRVVRPETVRQMWTAGTTSDGKQTGYGLGFGVRGAGETLAVSHSGNQSGASSLLRISPARRAVVVVMTNLEGAPVGEIAGDVIRIMNAASGTAK
jgi:CubicO group peptidase (beta-lactamase class C family)